MFERIFNFVQQKKLVRVILIYMARQLNEREVMNLQRAFNHINTSHDAEITEEQFLKAGTEVGFAPEELSLCFKELDMTGRGTLGYTQFVASCMLTKEYIKDDIVYMVFRIWDVDRDGLLSLDDFTTFIQGEYPGFLESSYGKELL